MGCTDSKTKKSHIEEGPKIEIKRGEVHNAQTPGQFRQLVESTEGLVCIDFFATWCPPCKLISPEVEKIAKTELDVLFIKIDVDENTQMTEQFNIT